MGTAWAQRHHPHPQPSHPHAHPQVGGATFNPNIQLVPGGTFNPAEMCLRLGLDINNFRPDSDTAEVRGMPHRAASHRRRALRKPFTHACTVSTLPSPSPSPSPPPSPAPRAKQLIS